MHFEPFAVSPYFTPTGVLAAAAGGVLLGFCVAFKTGVIGEVLGVSGSVRCAVRTLDPKQSCFGFILGLVLAGACMSHIYGGFEAFPVMPTSEGRTELMVRYALGGLFVGFGTAMGNGCTSGHGLTGLARLTPRSWVAVPTFMASAMVAATLLKTGSMMPELAASPQSNAQPVIASGIALTALALLTLGVLGAKGKKQQGAAPSERTALELAVGFLFGVGLTICTMVRPGKVAGFLDFGSGAWDPSLAFVMGSALAVTLPFYQLFERGDERRTILGGTVSLPPKTKPLDHDVVIGPIIFGLGWGTCGMCPGPMLVVLGANPCVEVAVALVGLVIGMKGFLLVQTCREQCEAESSSSAGSSDSDSEMGSGSEYSSSVDDQTGPATGKLVAGYSSPRTKLIA